MLFYNSANPAPNPRRVRIFLAEKGIERAEAACLDPQARAQGAPSILAVNPLGQTPALALDDGSVLTESVSICRYFEALHPDAADVRRRRRARSPRSTCGSAASNCG